MTNTQSVIRAFLALLSGALLLALAACSDNSNDGPSREACGSSTWRTSNAGVVLCPGADSCECSGGQVCCVPPNPAATDVGTCSDLGACTGVAFACNGPEDCGAGTVCCAKGYSAACSTAAECFGVDTYVLCHADQDCTTQLGATCGPADPGTYWSNLMGVCRN